MGNQANLAFILDQASRKGRVWGTKHLAIEFFLPYTHCSPLVQTISCLCYNHSLIIVNPGSDLAPQLNSTRFIFPFR